MNFFILVVLVTVKTTSGLIGSRNTTIADYPYTLSISVKGTYKCGAALIAPILAVTAAQCINGISASNITVRMNSNHYGECGEVAPVKNICQHPKFDPKSLDYDIAVLKFTRPICPLLNAKPIPLRSVGKIFGYRAMGKVTGWGESYPNGPLAKSLQVIDVAYEFSEQCRKEYATNFSITDRMLCFGNFFEGFGICPGDVGSPLAVDGELIGVLTYSNGCDSSMYPGVYTTITDYEINDHIQQCSEKYIVTLPRH